VNRAVERRLRKLEMASPEQKARVFVIEGTTQADPEAHIDELISSGAAKPSDTFIITGVPRSDQPVGGYHPLR
jgi:hypothetical protein